MGVDTDKFTKMHNSLYNKVFSYVSLRIRDREEATDLVQEVFLKAYRTWKEVPDERTSRNFLYIISRGKVIDYLRNSRQKYLVKLPFSRNDEFEEFGDSFDQIAGDDPLPEEIFEKNENNILAKELLDILSPIEKEIMTLRFLEELEYDELAEVFKTTKENIRQKVSRALTKLKKHNTNKGRN